MTLLLQEPSCTKVILPHTSRGKFIQEFGWEDELAETSQNEQISKVKSLRISEAGDTLKYFHIDKMVEPKKEVEENMKWLNDDVKEENFKKEGETYKSEYERPVRLLEEILEDFCWPEGQQGQNYHRMRWRFPRGKVGGC